MYLYYILFLIICACSWIATRVISHLWLFITFVEQIPSNTVHINEYVSCISVMRNWPPMVWLKLKLRHSALVRFRIKSWNLYTQSWSKRIHPLFADTVKACLWQYWMLVQTCEYRVIFCTQRSKQLFRSMVRVSIKPCLLSTPTSDFLCLSSFLVSSVRNLPNKLYFLNRNIMK